MSSIVVTGGGTGGHLAIAKVIATEIKSRGFETIFIGSTHGQDREWFEGSNLFSKTYFLQSSGVINKKGLAKFSSLFNILNLSKECANIFKTHQIKAVFSVGGYSASPACFACVFTKTPLFIHEQNAFIGRLNRLFKPFSKGFYSSYSKPKFDYPVGGRFFQSARNRTSLKKVLFLGGSQGAKFINDLALDLALNLTKKDILISHQCGKADFERVAKFYADNSIKADVFAFSKELDIKMNMADLCISRSGASTLWELCANKLPAIFIPFPYAANDHQFYNARFLANSNLAKIFRQDEISQNFIDEILSYDIATTSKNLSKILSPNAAKTIVDDMFIKLGYSINSSAV
ncbi:UDP-N-acetylglucosamine--N-acetylmuramyl-(pentapeptide) pyrophosphoryl-undecaprenol N-acetylglucosamine transferase [Campylobacter corcagiensis]|uniref:UDP-N-acetylglucosamine--N-acetylmuramyl-(pentapeptide) pyrophosphoryl-undecaprenol N-acetylglucosamine transferase n=1 Tax=Campylobacter corcagiensis TaxID=1448857 RepID=A0A7M1LGQ9_9BACT|nr:UDP-N-acetylglucosamine--N-acetylmuramyl-(pentapeptide) pyrophosphoryl-undecaprenol N-acetylglucosamine transferase [Campylobacter corcagiensis]QKF64614.1 N-acetylglucosaminyl transferase [Campylobacter corcagiensis]QOQ87214.1 UDP-N-acetylglucosamine--N-acetylmuramyl-(pentapeptide) pyrophosphoryl-undecaprenol N-acetylglucosamine transferase [Campylobacter corcagiensis]